MLADLTRKREAEIREDLDLGPGAWTDETVAELLEAAVRYRDEAERLRGELERSRQWRADFEALDQAAAGIGFYLPYLGQHVEVVTTCDERVTGVLYVVTAEHIRIGSENGQVIPHSFVAAVRPAAGAAIAGPDSPDPPGVEEERARLRAVLEEALHLRMCGERAPGGSETWRDWDRKAEQVLRAGIGTGAGP